LTVSRTGSWWRRRHPKRTLVVFH